MQDTSHAFFRQLLETPSPSGFEQAIRSISERVPLSVSEHEIVLHGACPDCREG